MMTSIELQSEQNAVMPHDRKDSRIKGEGRPLMDGVDVIVTEAEQ
jgi:hypothetical protein